MDSEQEFFEQQRPEVAQVIGTAVMQLLIESGEGVEGFDSRDDRGTVSGGTGNFSRRASY